MSMLDVIKKRGSIRNFKDKQIDKEELLKILESARLSQSAANRQPWQFVVVTNESMKKKLSRAASNQQFVGRAAVVIVCLADPSISAKVGQFDGFLIDLAISVENMVLTAWDLGIGSCWIGAFWEDEVKGLLGIPGNLRVISLLALGYPDQEPRSKSRKDLNEIVHFEKY